MRSTNQKGEYTKGTKQSKAIYHTTMCHHEEPFKCHKYTTKNYDLKKKTI